MSLPKTLASHSLAKSSTELKWYFGDFPTSDPFDAERTLRVSSELEDYTDHLARWLAPSTSRYVTVQDNALFVEVIEDALLSKLLQEVAARTRKGESEEEVGSGFWRFQCCFLSLLAMTLVYMVV